MVEDVQGSRSQGGVMGMKTALTVDEGRFLIGDVWKWKRRNET